MTREMTGALNLLFIVAVLVVWFWMAKRVHRTTPPRVILQRLAIWAVLVGAGVAVWWFTHR